MTDNTQPLALMLADRLHHEQPTVLRIDAEHAGEELRRQHARIAELESELEAVGAGGVQALSAAPGEPSAHQILAITTAYEQGVGKGRQAHSSGKEIANPYDSAYRCDLAWQYGYKEGKEQAQREAKAAPKQEAQEPVGVVEHAQAQTSYIHWTAAPPPNGAKLYTAPQPAPAQLSDDAMDAARWRMAVLIGNELMLRPDKRTHATAAKAYMDATHSGSDLTGAVDAALAAQGGKA